MCDNYSENDESKDLNYFRIDNSKKSIDNDNSVMDEKSIFSFTKFDPKIDEQFKKKKELNDQKEIENIYNKYIKKNNELQLENEHNDEKIGYTSKNKNFIKNIKNPIHKLKYFEQKIINQNRKIKNNKNNKKNQNTSENIIRSVEKQENMENLTNFENENIENKRNNDENNNNENIENIGNKSEEIKEKKILGRKTKNAEKKKEGHNKFTDDNLIRKVKCTLLEAISSFINSLLKRIYKDNKSNIQNKKELLKMNQGQIINSKADYNQIFINKPLKEIFSYKISSKYTNYFPNHNSELIKSLLNEKNEEIKILFTDIFNLTFFNCLEHFRGSQKYHILEGLTSLDEICNKFKEEPDYVEIFKQYVNTFERIINNKKARNRISWKKKKIE